MASKTYNVAVIGYGLSAKVFHIPFINDTPEFNLYAVVQRTPRGDDNAETDFPTVKGYRAVEEMLQDQEVDLVVVTSTPEVHYQHTKMALEAGKHVVVEKPFAPTHKEADALVALAEKHGRILTVYQNRRWDADFVTLSELVKNGTLGRVAEFETHFDRHRPVPSKVNWKIKVMPGGSALYDLGTHILDQAVHLLGMPKKITGFVGSQREDNPSGYEDFFTVLLHYDSLLVTAKATVISPEENQLRFWVRGDKGSYKKYDLDPQESQLLRGMKPGDPGYAVEPSESYGVLTACKDGKLSSEKLPSVKPPTYGEYYRRLARALAGQGEVPVRPAESSAVIRLLELAQESSKLGKTLEV